MKNARSRKAMQGQLTPWRTSPLDAILHPSLWRLRLLGLALALAQPGFGLVWAIALPQPYENAALRVLMGLLGMVLVLPALTRELSSFRTRLLFTLIVWIEFPLFLSWMYLCNGGNAVWLATVCAGVVIYYHLTDWRLATAGVAVGAVVAHMAFFWLPPDGKLTVIGSSATNAVVIGFSWGCALLLGMSSADLRRAHLANTLATIGIMAHELRTPLSTAALLGDALQLEVERQPGTPRAAKLETLAQRLHTLVRNMNHQIDTQIANARLLQLPRYKQRISAADLVNEVVAAYPFPSSRQRECVRVSVRNDFTFASSSAQFSQVLDNMIKNALHSLAAADSKYPYCALRIDVGLRDDHGIISLTDDGMGIDEALLPHIFEPFFSSNRGTGHGLGLAFCQQVVQHSGGTIAVRSGYANGATFTISLPLAHAHSPGAADSGNFH